MQGASMLAASPHGAADVGDAAIGSSRPGRALAPRGLSCSEGRSEGQSGYESTVSLPYWAPQGRSRAQSKDRGYKLPFDNYAQPRRAHVPVEGFADSKVRGSGWAGPPSVSAESNLTTRSPPQPSSSSPDLHAPADPPQWRHRGGRSRRLALVPLGCSLAGRPLRQAGRHTPRVWRRPKRAKSLCHRPVRKATGTRASMTSALTMATLLAPCRSTTGKSSLTATQIPKPMAMPERAPTQGVSIRGCTATGGQSPAEWSTRTTVARTVPMRSPVHHQR